MILSGFLLCDIVRISSQYVTSPGRASCHEDGFNAVLITCSQTVFCSDGIWPQYSEFSKVL